MRKNSMDPQASALKNILRHPIKYLREGLPDAFAREQAEWTKRWCAIESMWWREVDAPKLLEEVALPAGNPTVKRLLFQLMPGSKFEQVEGAHRELGSCLGSDRVVVERFTYDDDKTRECLYAFIVTYELGAVYNPKLGKNPHLYPQNLHKDEQEFAVRCALGNAFVDVGVGAPIFVDATLAGTDDRTLWRTMWALPGTMSYDAFDANGAKKKKARQTIRRIQEHLGSDTLDIEPSSTRTFALCFSKKLEIMASDDAETDE